MSDHLGLTRDDLVALLAERTRERDAARQQQAATAEVLKVISRPDFDLEVALFTLVQRAAQLCNAGPAQIFRREGDVYRYAVSRILNPVYREIERRSAILPGRGTLVGRVALEGRCVHIVDAWDDPDYGPKDEARIGNVRTMLGVPLLGRGETIGVMVLGRSEVEPFSAAEVELVTTFADQAVIAMETVRLLHEAEERTREVERSLDDLRRAQDHLVQSEKLASLGQLVSGIAHEINTPLGNALTVATALGDEVRALAAAIDAGVLLRSDLRRSTGRLGEGTALVAASLTRAAGLVQSFRQISSDRIGGKRRTFSVKPWLQETLRGRRSERHRISIACPDECHATGYPETLAEILLALVANSYLHAFPPPRAGLVAVGAGTVGRDILELTVEDDGCGIAREHVGRVFDPFFTTARGSGSVGLGLHIAHNLVVAMKGRISVDSRVGQGTRFTVAVPAG